MLSAGFILTQRVLKRMRDGDWLKTQQRLVEEYPGHPKERMFEHIAIMILYLEEYFRASEMDKNVWKLVQEWMKSQKECCPK